MFLKTSSILIWSISLLFCLPLFAQHQDAGTTGFNTLKLLYSARANAMGQAMTGRVMNYDGMQANPASMLRTPTDAVSSTFMDYFVGSGGGSLQYLQSKNIYSAWGVFINYWNSGAIDRTEISDSGELLELDDTFGAQNLIAGFSMARFLSPAVDIGGTLKLIWDQIDDKQATGVLIDAGLMHHTANEKIKIGLTVRNLGLQTSYYTDEKYKEGMPTTFGAGLGYDFKPESKLNLDIVKANGDNFVVKAGFEQQVHPNLSLRAGFRSNAGDYYQGGALSWTSGISLGAGWTWKNIALDYAVFSYGDLGIVNQLGMRYHFSDMIR